MLIAAIVALSLAPVVYVGARALDASRDVAYWDEIDTAIALGLDLERGVTPSGFFKLLFAMNNEHRMVTSRLLFAASYWLTGTVDFEIIGLIGNATLAALCVLLLVVIKGSDRRLLLGVLLAFILFQLQHYENFLWSGSSIDHFQVALLAGGSIVALARGTPASVCAGGVLATLATLTLAHGLLLWPIGAAMLWQRQRPTKMLAWLLFAAVGITVFLTGFESNPSHRFATLSWDGALMITGYWLTLLGAVPGYMHPILSPWLGALLLGILGWAAIGGALGRERVAFPLACFGVGALVLIAIGRAEISGGEIVSRYLILGALAWASALFIVIDRICQGRSALRVIAWLLPWLVAFNVGANVLTDSQAESWIECRDRAAIQFAEDGEDDDGPFHLHPVPSHATNLLNQAAHQGVYQMDPLCEPRSFPKARPSERIAYFVEKMSVDERAVTAVGWAGIKGMRSRRGTLHVVLRSADARYVYSTVTVTRPDVVAAHGENGWRRSGFHFSYPRQKIPDGEYQLGFLIAGRGKGEYIMTAHRFILIDEGKALLASGD